MDKCGLDFVTKTVEGNTCSQGKEAIWDKIYLKVLKSIQPEPRQLRVL